MVKLIVFTLYIALLDCDWPKVHSFSFDPSESSRGNNVNLHNWIEMGQNSIYLILTHLGPVGLIMYIYTTGLRWAKTPFI